MDDCTTFIAADSSPQSDRITDGLRSRFAALSNHQRALSCTFDHQAAPDRHVLENVKESGPNV
jgi:hypothetical protein